MTRRRSARTIGSIILTALLVVALGAAPATAQSVLRVAAESDLKSLDPIWTTAAITASHGFMIFDQLFAEDSKFDVKPQMVERWQSSPDGLVWSFTLRPGLKLADGTPVTSKDVVPSINRWGARIASGQLLMTRVREVVATGRADLRDPPEGQVPGGGGDAGRLRPAALRHAGEGRADRSIQAGHRDGRLGPLHLPQGRVGAR